MLPAVAGWSFEAAETSVGGPPGAGVEAPPALAAALANALRSAGYSARGVRDAIGSGPAVSLSAADVVAVKSRLEGSPLGPLIELFLLGLPLTTARAGTALAPVPLDALAAGGLIDCAGDAVRAGIRVLPYEDLLVACDRDPELDGRLARDHVGGIHASSVLLARITPRRCVDRALDIGCGCGFQALLLARHARNVVASDINPRALEFGRLNAWLNGLENISWRLGDGLEPARGELFDLVVSNPPYVIAPRSRFTFRESPLPGDAFCEQLTRATPDLLADGGVSCLLASWIVGPGEHWSTRPAGWTGAAGLGRLLLHFETIDAAANAVRWAVPAGSAGREDAAALVSEWLAHYRATRTRAIAYGALVVRRGAAPQGWLARLELAATPGPEAGAQIERILDGHDLLADGSAAALLDTVLTLAPGHRLDWTLGAAAGSWEMRRSQLSLEGGLGIGLELDRPTARLVAQLDGRRTLRELLIAADSGQESPLEPLIELIRAGLIGVSRRR